MIKKITAFFCITAIAAMLASPVRSAPAAYIDAAGTYIRLSTAPVSADGTVYYPIGEISQKLGMTTEKSGGKVSVKVNGHSMEFTAPCDTAEVDMVTVPAKSPFVRNNDVMVGESFFTDYMKYIGFPCEMREVLTFTSVSEILPETEKETEDEFYSKLEKDGCLIEENQLFSALVIGAANMKTEQVSISDLPGYDKAMRVTTLREPTAVYECQLKMIPKADLLSGRFGLVSYWAKAEEISDESGYAYAGPCYEQKTGAHTKAGSANQEIEQGVWKKHYMLVSANDLDYTKDGSQFNMRFGYKPQTALIAGLRAELLSAEYTKADVTYANESADTYFGREENALWRDEALKRIEKYRKTDITVNVTDKDNNPVSGAEIDARMEKNEFMFGTAVHNNLLQASTAADASYKAKKYAECVQKHFNTVVFDTAGKWRTIEPDRAAYATGIYNWANERNINVRGHALFWDNSEYYSESFNSAQSYMTTDEKYQRVREHINENMTYFSDNLGQWDLLNEPLANRSLIRNIGYEKTAQLFNEAKKIAPEVSLYVNETGINGNHSNWQQVKKLRSFVENLKNNGAAVDGIGIQSHCGGALRYPQEFYNQLDYLSAAADEIAVTEYDFTVSDEQLAADNLRDMLIAAYSHPKSTGFLTWGFWDGQHWKNNAPFFDINWKEKQALAVWDEYVNNEWKTRAGGTTNSDGVYTFRGHKGEYRITVTYNGQTQSAVFDTKKGGVINVTVGENAEINPDSVPQKKSALVQSEYLKWRTDTEMGEKMPSYQLPEEYDQSIIAGKNKGISGIYVYDDFESYGTDGCDENGKYINPVTAQNIYGQWYGAEASQKRGTVLAKTGETLSLSFYRQNNPQVLKSSISRELSPNCSALDSENGSYEFNIRFYIPQGDKGVGIRYGRYVKFALDRTAAEETDGFLGIYSNAQKPENPILKYAQNGETTLKENTWYELSLSLVPDGMGGMLMGGTLKNGENTENLKQCNMRFKKDLRFLNMTVNCYTSETYTRSVFYLDSIEFKEKEIDFPIVFKGQEVCFHADADLTAIAAAYDKGSGELLETEVKELPGNGQAMIYLKTAFGETVGAKAFLWRKTMQPAAYAEKQ